MRDRKSSNQLNNKGFSLIELLVAIVILAIIVVPLLHSFVTSIRTNAKSRSNMHGTSIAEDILEKYEAYTIDEMAEQYLGDAAYTLTDGAGNSLADLAAVDAVLEQADGTLIVNGKDSTTTSTTYDVRITLSPSTDTVADGSSINAKELVDLLNLSGTLNAVYEDDENEAIQAYESIAVQAGKLTADQIALLDDGTVDTATKDSVKNTLLNVAGNTTREITVNLSTNRVVANKSEKDAQGNVTGTNTYDADAYLVTASVVYTYQDSANSTIYTYPQSGASSHIIFSNEDAVRNGADSTLANIIFCISPRYESGGSQAADKIIVKNPNNIESNFLLVLQNRSEKFMDTKTISAGSKENYHFYYELQESHNWVGTSGKASLSLRSNALRNGTQPGYKSNIYCYQDLLATATNYYGQGYINESQSESKDAAGINYWTGAGQTVLSILDADDLTAKQKRNRLYTITVEVFSENHDAADSAIMSMSGTVTN